MFSLVNGLRCGQQVIRSTGQVRNVSCGMPRNRVSFVERVAHGVVIACGILATPAYIATNIKNYRGKEE
ncbi:hypothetical protein KQX54_005781 [Cotesia glomerata]|uniref:Uncharacterized protein n=1 Tax=Cotesia glomerata TaxID=32391 RepID=A0AAV7I3Z6_COTGL|nr:hypothetical protein KQX54_005781 [Cotesia glomerata]